MKAKFINLTSAAGIAFSAILILMVALSSVNAATPSLTSQTWTDEFATSSLDSHWSWIREDNTHWSLTDSPGFMRITTQQGGLLNDGGDAQNLLLRNAPVGDFEFETHVIFTPTENFQIAGLLVYQDDDNFLLLGRAYCGFIPPCVGNGIYFDHEEQGTFIGGNFAMTTTITGEAYFRLVRHSTIYTGYISENGTDWTMVGAHTVISGMIPSKVGLAAEDGYQGAVETPADFDYFRLVDNSRHVYLPVVIK
jgi:beta-xylosidase